ncbi:MAG: DNA gyrase inhibitor YacG [Pseudomonadota bacterium]
MDHNSASSQKRGPRCPICGRPTQAAYRPFCSKRCADIDLGRWLGGKYAIAVTEDDDEDGLKPDDVVPENGRDVH